MPVYNDYPLPEIMRACIRLTDEGWTIYQKWTCERCGDRVTGNNANTITSHGYHEDCGHTTDLTKCGCNYLKAKII